MKGIEMQFRKQGTTIDQIGEIAEAPEPSQNNARDEKSRRKLKAQWAQALGEIFNWPKDRREDPIIMTTAADGSGLGPAVISAMTLQRVQRGDMTGLRPE